MIKYFLTINIGSSDHSVALFDAQEKFIEKRDYEEIDALMRSRKLTIENTYGAVASVKDSNFQDIPIKHQLTRRLLLHKVFFDMPVSYSETIQDYRLANAYFLFKQNNKSKMIIDCDHITTIDFVTSEGFQGGHTIPSFQRMKNIFRYDEYFKHFVEDENQTANYTNRLPQDNKESLIQGSLAAYYFAIKGIIKEYSPEEIYLTGFNGTNVADFLKPSVKKMGSAMYYNGDLIHKSLCFIARKVQR